MCTESSQRTTRDMLLSDYDVQDAAIEFAIEGMLTTEDLWWLYEEHRIMAPSDAWLLTANWEDELDETLVDRTLADPWWWEWYDHGLYEARHRR